MRIVGLLARIVALLDEQNQILRELHLRLTGSHALAPKRGLPTVPSPPRIRTGSDVFVRIPLTEAELQDRALRSRSVAASQPVPLFEEQVDVRKPPPDTPETPNDGPAPGMTTNERG